MRAALLQAAAHALHFDTEAVIAQALLEFSVFPGRPDGEHAIDLQSCANGGQSAVVIKPAVFGCGKSGRSVVHIKEDRIKLIASRTEYVGDVTHIDSHTPVFQGMLRQWPERATVPLHDCRHEFGDSNPRIAWKKIQRRTQRKSHSETADEDTWPD